MKSYKYLYVLAFAFFLIIAFNQPVSSQTKDRQIEKDTTITIQVTGIRCSGDLPIICQRVKKEKGIANCNAVSNAAATSKFDITYNPALISFEQIVDAVKDAPSCDFPNEKPYRVKKKK